MGLNKCVCVYIYNNNNNKLFFLKKKFIFNEMN